MRPEACLFADPQNPRTEIPEAELTELAGDIRQRGILQAIVVHPADGDGRHQIHFGAKRWFAAQRIGLQAVPVVVRNAPADAYAQVAENQERHGLTPLDLARFIRCKIDGGESNATVAGRLRMDQTTLAHHLALLTLPPVLDDAMNSGRCSSPRTLYELSKLHADQPDRVAELVVGSEPITGDAVAGLRDEVMAATVANNIKTPTLPRSRSPNPPNPLNQQTRLLARANLLCARLDAVLLRLSRTDLATIAAGDRAALRQQVVALASWLDRQA